MNISRDWATPLTIGIFGLMATTGVLMFFHLDSGLNETAHEWLGWVMVAGVAAHASANWAGFKRYFLAKAPGRAILASCALITLASFSPAPGRDGENLPPPVMALKAVTNAPLSRVADLSGKPAERLVSELNQAGIAVSGPADTLSSITAGDRELEGKAIRVIFGKP